MLTLPWVVLGGGVVGVAQARALARLGAEVVLIEALPRPGGEGTSRNSGVVHAGLHYPPSWLKTRSCVRGRERLVALAERAGLPWRRTGKLIVAQDAEEAERLDAVAANAAACGVEGVVHWDRQRLAAEEPEVRGLAALHVPVSGIVDPHALTDRLWAEAEAAGATGLFETRVVAVRAVPEGTELEIDEAGRRTHLLARGFVNAAGLEADRWARDLGIEVHQVACRGTWWRLHARHAGRVRRLVYPVPPRGLAGLGVHLTLELDGGLKLGPDVRWPDAEGRPAPRRPDPADRERFFEAGRRYLPWLEEEDLSPDTAGWRPKLVGPGEPPRDFLRRLQRTETGALRIHLLGIESPGLTAAMALPPEGLFARALDGSLGGS